MQEDDLLMLSGIQHIAFCERQWAFIHIEQQWSDNVLTVEGHHLHERVDDPLESDKRGDTIVLRAVSLSSNSLGLSGRADVVELKKVNDDASENTISLKDHIGRWKVIPVEYKRGKPKPDERDEVQLCAQAMCLEEMYQIRINYGFLYYGETRRRIEVKFSEELRNLVKKYSKRMHELYTNGITPLPVFKSHCKSCSLLDICLPDTLSKSQQVGAYLESIILDSQDIPYVKE
jgi:CRISPR-associated exonuclease Cas4